MTTPVRLAGDQCTRSRHRTRWWRSSASAPRTGTGTPSWSRSCPNGAFSGSSPWRIGSVDVFAFTRSETVTAGPKYHQQLNRWLRAPKSASPCASRWPIRGYERRRRRGEARLASAHADSQRVSARGTRRRPWWCHHRSPPRRLAASPPRRLAGQRTPGHSRRAETTHQLRRSDRRRRCAGQLAARVRLLSTGHGRKSDDADATSLGIAALTAARLQDALWGSMPITIAPLAVLSFPKLLFNPLLLQPLLQDPPFDTERCRL